MTDSQLLSRMLSAPLRNSRPCIWMEYLKDAPAGASFSEFGVWNGRSINYMADCRPDCWFHGFDSFEGLPEEWDSAHPKGHFASNLSKLSFKPNVIVHQGWFEDTIGKAKSLAPFYGIHIDCDLGSSTTTVLEGLSEAILADKPKILFDEMLNYKGYEQHEFAAFLAWVNRTNATFEVLARNASHQQVLVQIT